MDDGAQDDDGGRALTTTILGSLAGYDGGRLGSERLSARGRRRRAVAPGIAAALG